MNAQNTHQLSTTSRASIAGLTLLTTCNSAFAATDKTADFVPSITVDYVGIAILITLLAGIVIAILLSLLDRFQALCNQSLRLVEIALRERSNTPSDFDEFRPPLPSAHRGHLESCATQVSVPSGSPATRRRTFRVELARDLLPRIHDYITGFLAQHGREKEAGGMFVGEYLLDEVTQVATFKIRGFIEAGPSADFSAGSILFDGEYQTGALRALQVEHPGVDNIGCVHRHPGSLDVNSSGDLVSDREAVSDAGTKALVFGIITLNNSRPLPSSLFFRDFKIDFYLMAEDTGLEYEPILPTVVDLPLVEASPALTDLHALRGAALGFDLAVLKQLPGLVQATLRKLDAATGVLLTATFEDLAEPLQVWIQPSGALSVFYQAHDGSRSELNGPWTQAELGGHVWLSHLLLKARKTLAAPAPIYHRHFGILEDKPRLVFEVRSMNLLFGDRARLRQRGSLVYWDYTVRESGREFPIEVRYPDEYPAVPPEIYSVKRLPYTPHRLGDHDPCWINPVVNEWNPARDTAAICVHVAHKYFACALVYVTLGHWPKGAEH